uniref:Uncharacterized protein n=1 Tax=Populus trichocarpa TaxID=3694 RepID=A9P861_POPTR|nr:unknown [Populus trichocarpa]
MSSHQQVLSCLPYMKRKRMKMGFSMLPTAERTLSELRFHCSHLWLPRFFPGFTKFDFMTIVYTALCQ